LIFLVLFASRQKERKQTTVSNIAVYTGIRTKLIIVNLL